MTTTPHDAEITSLNILFPSLGPIIYEKEKVKKKAHMTSDNNDAK